MQCVPCIYVIHTLYSHGTYIVFNMIPRHLHWKLYSLVKYMTCLVIHTSTQRIAMTFIDVGYTCDVNTVTLHNVGRMKIVIFTLPINVNNKSHDFVAHFPRIQTCMLKKRDTMSL